MVANDKGWQQRTDAWINATDESRRRKEARKQLRERLINQQWDRDEPLPSEKDVQGSSSSSPSATS